VTARSHWCVVTFLVAAAACSSSTAPSSARENQTSTVSSAKVVTISEVRAAMVHAKTARIRGSAQLDGAPPGAKPTLSGFARFAPAEYDLIGRAGANKIEHLVLGSVVFTRGSLLTSTGRSWCRSDESAYPTIAVSGALFSVKASDAGPIRIGDDRSAGVPTTHYRLSPKNGPTVDYWIDHAHRIVQMSWASDAGEHDTEYFYDYGAAVPPITTPSNAPAC
jgi:hypothetical protein